MSTTGADGQSFFSNVFVIIAIGLILLPVLAWNQVFQDFFRRVLKIDNPVWYAVVLTLIVALIIWLLAMLFKPKPAPNVVVANF